MPIRISRKKWSPLELAASFRFATHFFGAFATYLYLFNKVPGVMGVVSNFLLMTLVWTIAFQGLDHHERILKEQAERNLEKWLTEK